MRVASAPELVLLAGTAFNVYRRIWVANADGTFKDLSALAGADWTIESEIDVDIDQPIAECTVRLKRDLSSTLSLSPLRSDSTVNVKDDLVTFASLVDAGRDFYVETAVVAAGASPGGGDWKEMFRGIIDKVSFGQEPFEFRGRDLGGELADTWYAVKQTFTFPDDSAVDIEAALQDLLDRSGLTVTLYTPTSPSYKVTQYGFDVEPALDAMTRLAQSIGWDLRYKWHEGTSTWRLTLYDPQRSKTTPDATIGAAQYIDVKSLEIDRTTVRNDIRVFFGPVLTDSDSRAVATATDGTSQARYGPRNVIIQEDSSSAINTQAEADAMADAILADLKDPKAEQSVEMLYYWPVELTDLHRYSANSVHYNANQDLAVVRIRHILGGGDGTQHRTTVDVRGKPAGAFDGWIRRAGRGQGSPDGQAVIPFRVTVSTAEYDSVAGTWTLWFRLYQTQPDGTELEITDATVWGASPWGTSLYDPIAQTYVIQESTSHVDATGVIYPTSPFNLAPYDAARLGWPVTWDSTDSEGWDFKQLLTTPTGVLTTTADITVQAFTSGLGIVEKPRPLTNINVNTRLREHDAQIGTLARAVDDSHLNITDFAPPTWLGGTADDDAITAALLLAGFIENKPVLFGSRDLWWTTPKIMKGPGGKFTPSSGGGAGANGVYYTGTGTALTIQGDPTPGSDAVRLTELDITITGAGQVANGLYMNFVTFSQGARVRVANFKGSGVKIRKFQDALWGEFSIENCGWSSLGNQDVTGINDGLALEEYAFDRDGSGGDTSNESHVLRVQVEQSRFLAIRDVGQLANVTCNIHSERTMFATSAAYTRYAWFFTGARSVYNQGRFHANSEKNLVINAEFFAGAAWTAIGTPTISSTATVDGDAILDRIGDDAAGTLEGYSQPIVFTGDGTKAFSIFVKQGTSTSSVFHLLDTTAANGRLQGILTWDADGLPVVAIGSSLGTYLGYEVCPNGIFRLLFSTTSGVIAANTNSLRIYPATNAAFTVASTGTLLVGGVQFENATTPGRFAKTGSTSVPADQNATILLAGETMTFNNFNVEGEVTIQTFGSAGTTLEINNPNFTGRFRNDFGGGGGPVKVVRGKCTLVKTGIDPAIEDALTFEGTQIPTLSVGDCGNPGLGRRFKLFGGRVGLLTSDSANSGIEAFGTVFDNVRDGCEYQSIFHNCTILAATGGAVANTWSGRGYVEIDGGTIVPAFTMGNGLTLNAYGGVHALGLWTQATVASVLAPGLRLAGGISGFGIPTANPDVHAQWATAWKRGQVHWNYAWTGSTDPVFWEYTTSWQPVYVGAAVPVEAPTGSTIPIRTSGGDLRAVGLTTETGASTGVVYFGSSHNGSIVWDGTNWAIVGNGIQVVGGRRTGWTASTGTPTRSGFATSTATATQVAEALKALIDDLMAHGLIGA